MYVEVVSCAVPADSPSGTPPVGGPIPDRQDIIVIESRSRPRAYYAKAGNLLLPLVFAGKMIVAESVQRA